MVSKEGIRPNPKKVDTLVKMSEPTTVDELINFTYGVAWFRTHIPYFSEISAPLYDTINAGLERFKKKTSQNGKKVKLSEVPAWAEGKLATKKVKEALAESMTTAFFDPNKKLCFFADASDDYWCLMVTMCEPGDEKLPWDQQAGKHQLLALESGRFRHAQRRWHTVDKEGFCFGVKLRDYSHWIKGSKHPAALFTDHRNLLAFFADEVRPASCTKPNRERLTRWGLQLAGLNYEIFHISGAENRLADLGSRWGNKFAKSKTDGLRGGPRPLILRVLHAQLPKTTREVKAPDLDLGRSKILPLNRKMVRREELCAVQAKHAAERPAKLQHSRDEPQLWINEAGKIWIPASANKMKRALYALAHQGIAGHRGHKATLRLLTSRFFWKSMRTEVKEWGKHCLQCIKLHTGEVVPRPWGTQLMAEYPGEIVSMDYIKIGTTKTGFSYVLIVVDKLTRLVMFVPAGKATAILAARTLLRWSAQHGLPKWLISDGGSHFRNDIMRELTQLMGIEHHITLAYCPWANGSVEIMGRDLLWTLRALTSEFRLSIDEWDLVLPLVEFTLNAKWRDVLAGRSALEVMNGQKTANPVNLAVWAGVRMKNARKFSTTTTRVEQHCACLEISLARLHEAARDVQEARDRRRATRNQRTHSQEFAVGDYVMVKAEDTQANPIRGHKAMVHWQGPYEVTAAISATKYQVRLLGEDKQSTVHWQKMRRLAGPEMQIDEEITATALHDRHQFRVEQFDDWIMEGDEADLLVRWQNHGVEERTWESLQQLYEDVPEMVTKYVEQVGDPELELALNKCRAAVQAVKDQDDESHAANATNEVHASAGNAADRADQRTRSQTNAARDARAAARAAKK